MMSEIISKDKENEYKQYLALHRNYVTKAFEWFQENLPNIFEHGGLNYKVDIEMNVLFHDASKYLDAEFFPYMEYFYGSGENQEEFDKAWLIHIHKNPHHWQYWLLYEDEGDVKALDMDYPYIIEMICDWWSFSFKTGNLKEIFSWYEDHKHVIKLSDKTENLVKKILTLMEEKLDE